MSQDIEEMSGGTLRASVRSSADLQETQATPNDPYKVHTGVVRDDGSGQLVQSNGQYATAPGSVLGTARSNLGPTSRIGGSDCSMELEPGNPASRAHFSVALRMGLIKETSPGHFEDTQQAPQGAQEAPQETPGYVPELAPPEEEAAFAEVIAPVRQDSYDTAAAMATLAVNADTMGAWEDISDRLAQSEGIDSKVADAMVEQAHDFFTAQVTRAVATVGVSDPEPFYDWLRESKSKELTAATQALLGQRSTSAFKELAVQYRVHSGNAEIPRWQSMGFDAHVDRKTGELMVSRNGGRPVPARSL